MTCIQCGSEIPDTATFCPYCGSSQNFDDTQSDADSSKNNGSEDGDREEQGDSEYANANQDESEYVQQDGSNGVEFTYGKQVQSYLPLAIFSTLCYCVPVGIMAVLYATKVPELAKCGRYDEADECSKKALYWAIGAIVAGILAQTGSSLFSALMQYFNGGF